MQDTGHIMITLDIVIDFQLMQSFLFIAHLFPLKSQSAENFPQKFHHRSPDLIVRYQKSVTDMVNDSFPL